MADSDEEIERTATPDAEFYEQTLNPQELEVYEAKGPRSQVQDGKAGILTRKGTMRFLNLRWGKINTPRDGDLCSYL